MVEERKYLKIVLTAGEALELALKAIKDGKDKVDFALFENDYHKENPSAPHFKNNKIACWVDTYTPKKTEEERVDII